MNTQIDLILYHKMSIVPVSLRLTVFSKYIRYQDLQYFILMLLTKNFGHSKHNIALGSKGFRTRVRLEDNNSSLSLEKLWQ